MVAHSTAARSAISKPPTRRSWLRSTCKAREGRYLITSDDDDKARIERGAERMAETARPIEPTQPGGEGGDAPPQAPPEPARGSRDPATTNLPRSIALCERVKPQVGSAGRAALEERARQFRGQERGDDAPPDDPRTTNTDTPEVEPSRGSKREALFEPDDPRRTAGGN